MFGNDYYYDVDSELYYCGTRWYNPLWCRFISGDDIRYFDSENIGCVNMFAYCNNNPVNYRQGSVLGGSSITVPSISISGNVTVGGSSSSTIGSGWLGGLISGLSSIHGVVDKVSSYLAGSVDGLLNYAGISKFNGFQSKLNKYSNWLMGIGICLDVASSAYSNFNNSNLTTRQQWTSFGADVGYIGVTSGLSYLAGSLVTKGSVALGTAVGCAAITYLGVGFAGAIVIGAGVVVVGVVAGTILIAVVSDALDNWWEKKKEEWFS